MKTMLSLAVALVLSPLASGQIPGPHAAFPAPYIVGTATPVVDANGEAGWCNLSANYLALPPASKFFTFDLHCLPTGWVGDSTKVVMIGVELGFSSLPGVSVPCGASIYLPSANTAMLWMGPIFTDQAPSFGYSAPGPVPCQTLQISRNMARLNANWALLPALIGFQFTAQAVVLDSVTGCAYSSNALNGVFNP